MKHFVSVQEATHVKYQNQIYKIASKQGIGPQGQLAPPSKGGFSVTTVDGQVVSMWEAQEYLQEEQMLLDGPPLSKEEMDKVDKLTLGEIKQMLIDKGVNKDKFIDISAKLSVELVINKGLTLDELKGVGASLIIAGFGFEEMSKYDS